ncbi:MAG: RHS repeat-associated core domain-containing protein [Acidimicrobiales bacterium]
MPGTLWAHSGTRFTNMRARWYDTQSGVFTSVDPALSSTNQPYQYANGDPVNNSDPSGMGGQWGPVESLYATSGPCPTSTGQSSPPSSGGGLLIATVTIPASDPSQSAMPPSATPSPSGCGVQIDWPHISSYYLGYGQQRVKVNARDVCAIPVGELSLTVTLWKSSFWSIVGLNNKIISTKTHNSGQSVLGNTGSAGPVCNSNKKTSYWGVAIAQSIETAGTFYRSDKSPVVQISCGT